MNKSMWLLIVIALALIVLFILLGNQENEKMIQILLENSNHEFELINNESVFNIYFEENREEVFNFKLRNAIPKALYTFSLEIDLSDSPLTLYDIQAYLFSNGQDFENSKNIILKQHGNVVKIDKIIKANNSGEIEIKLHAELKKFLEDFEMKVTNIKIESIEHSEMFVVFKSTDLSIEMVFYKEDIVNSHLSEEDMNKLINEIVLIKDSMKSISDNHESRNQILVDCTQNMSVTGLSGTPIYINRQEVSNLLNSIDSSEQMGELSKNDFISIITHEISHIFDMQNTGNVFKPYIFDREFFATLKQVYALNTNGFTMDDNFISNKPKLSSGIYSNEVFLSRIIAILKLNDVKNNWNYVIETLKFLELIEEPLYNNIDYFYKFINELSRQSGIHIQKEFDVNEWKTLEMHFSNQ